MLTITVVLFLTRESRADNNLGLYLGSIQVAAMNIVALDKTYVDYFQSGLCFTKRSKKRQ
jgi:hypothetical protein